VPDRAVAIHVTHEFHVGGGIRPRGDVGADLQPRPRFDLQDARVHVLEQDAQPALGAGRVHDSERIALHTFRRLADQLDVDAVARDDHLIRQIGHRGPPSVARPVGGTQDQVHVVGRRHARRVG
jgi:hypothetical protein